MTILLPSAIAAGLALGASAVWLFFVLRDGSARAVSRTNRLGC